MRKYNPKTDIPRTGWDAEQIGHYLSIGTELFVDNGEVWTADKAEFVGKILNETCVAITTAQNDDTGVFGKKRCKSSTEKKNVLKSQNKGDSGKIHTTEEYRDLFSMENLKKYIIDTVNSIDDYRLIVYVYNFIRTL
ncbi:MAG: hypothetical protein MR966_14365 [Lachnospiraceae bacterium]|nr:hypothetical protein [Lachnospiraceae bacterium]